MKRSNAKKKIMLNVTVADVTYTTRVVEFPSVCPNPKCKADLTLPGAMDGIEYSSEERPMIIEGDCDVTYDPDEGPSTFDGASNLGWMFVSCRQCNKTLAEGSERDLDKSDEKKVG